MSGYTFPAILTGSLREAYIIMNNIVRLSLFLTLSCGLASASRAAITVYNAVLSGPNESPANASPGIGLAVVTINDTLLTMQVNVTFSGLTGTTTASHIHAATPTAFTGTAGVATTTPTFAGFPLGVTSGTFNATFDMSLASSYNPAYVTANGGTTASAFTALNTAIVGGKSYFNIHTSTFGSGEIRGFLVSAPEPGTLALAALGGLCLLRARRRNGA